MILGFNHNLQYKGETFHVQTEDSGVTNPHIITLLYRGGVILCSQKISYSDILKMDCLEVVVEELMKEQHKNMMRRLKSGEFDEKAFSIKPQLIENYEIPTLQPESDRIDDLPVSSSGVAKQTADHLPPQPVQDTSQHAVDLDDAILSFFGSPKK